MNPKIRTTFIPFAVFITALSLQGCNSTDCSEMVYTINRFDDHNDGACDSDCSLREGIIRSNECPGTQTLLLPAGTYNLTISGGWELGAAAGDLNLDDDVIIIGQGLAVIDANGIDKVFYISRVTVEMHNLFIRGGYAQSGAGIVNTGALTMHDSVVAYNHSTSQCGGIYSYWAEGWGTLSLVNTRVHDNMANIGGGICSWESLDMQGGSVDNNYANLHGGLFLMGEADLEGAEIWGNESGGDGGGISIGAGAMVENEINLTGVEIWGNTSAGKGGGIYHLKGALMLDQCAIYENLAEQVGGGIALEGQTPAVIGTEVRIENNEAQSGGGIYNAGSVLLYQSSLSGNRATNGRGGAIYTEQSEGGNPSVWLRNSTVSGNTASVDWSAGGLHNQVGSMRLEWVTIVDNSPRGIVNTSSGNITQDIVGSIVANNAADNCGWMANFTSRGHNLEDDDTCDFNGVADMVNTDPLLGALGDNGGFTLTHAPLIGSPAIDTGASSWCLAWDQRGVPRPQGTACDRGAFEKEPLRPEVHIPPPSTQMPPTSTPSPMPPMEVIGRFSMNGFCRYGPQVNYRDITALEVGTEVIVEGRSASDASPWWWILLPDSEAHCWVSNSVLELSDPVQACLLPIVDAPPLPPDAPPQLSIAERTCGATSQYTVLLSWEKASGAVGYKVYRDDNQLASLDAKTLSYKDAPPLGGPYTYTVEAYNDSGAAGASVVEKECSPVQ